MRTHILLLSILPIIAACISGCSSFKSSEAPEQINVTPASAVVQAGQKIQFSSTQTGGTLSNLTWYVDNVAGGNSTVGTITSTGLYTAPNNSSTTSVQVSVDDPGHKALSGAAEVSIFQPSKFAPGTISPSNNPLVASYTITAPKGATVSVEFGATTNYGLTTWTQSAPDTGGDVTILVAGMRADTSYHMRADVQLVSGNTAFSSDQVFKTGSIPAGTLPDLAVQQTTGADLGAGVEELSLFELGNPKLLTAVMSDVSGNVIWYYPIQPGQPFPMKLLPNGHILMIVGGINPTNGISISGKVDEIDLAGNVIHELTLADIQAGLTSIGFPVSNSGDAIPNHDILELPNGHWMIILSTEKFIDGQGDNGLVRGNTLVEWDLAKGPVWTWSTFDHIPLSYAPYGTADWTHANAVVYSPEDGDLLFSLRNLNWIVKIDYKNGAGGGDILWRLGPHGDFTLTGGTVPIDWNYAQHGLRLLGPATSGIFPITFFNNGNNRIVDTAGDVCGTNGATACYSDIPIFLVNEYTKTVELQQDLNLAPNYSTCCGSVDFLSNGDLEYDVAQNVLTPHVSIIHEVIPGSYTQVWQMSVTGQLAYRGIRIPSLYPGVEWTQAQIQTAGASLSTQPPRSAVK